MQKMFNFLQIQGEEGCVVNDCDVIRRLRLGGGAIFGFWFPRVANEITGLAEYRIAR
jgi:hypothetical protein